MPRIEISLPDQFNFSTIIPVRLGDINRGIHVGHVAMLSIMEEARAQFLVSIGYGEQVTIRKGRGFIMADVGIIYKSQAYYGKPVKVEIGVTDIKTKSFDLVYRISDAVSEIEIVRAKTGLLFFDYEKQKVVLVPEDFKNQFCKKNGNI